MPKQTLGVGIIGCGMIAGFHAKALAQIKGVKLLAVLDTVPAAVEKASANFGCAGYTDLKKFLAHPGLDVVTVATPSGSHMEPVIAAAEAGKHIICEKPIEVTLERIDKMIAACKKNKVILSGIFPKRFTEQVQLFKKAVDAGRLGKIITADASVKWFRSQGYYDGGGWRGTWKFDGGGALMNQSIHTIDLLYHLAGDVAEVCAFADRRDHERIEVEDVAAAILKFKNGAVGTLIGSTCCFSSTGHPVVVELTGSDGSIFMRESQFSAWDFRKKLSADAKVIEKFGLQSAGTAAGANDPSSIGFYLHQLNFENAFKSIRTGAPLAVDGNEARKSVEIILAIYKSALAGGKPVKLPLEKTPVRRSFR